MKNSLQIISITLSAAAGLFVAFLIVCLMPQKSEMPLSNTAPVERAEAEIPPLPDPIPVPAVTSPAVGAAVQAELPHLPVIEEESAPAPVSSNEAKLPNLIEAPKIPNNVSELPALPEIPVVEQKQESAPIPPVAAEPKQESEKAESLPGSFDMPDAPPIPDDSALPEAPVLPDAAVENTPAVETPAVESPAPDVSAENPSLPVLDKADTTPESPKPNVLQPTFSASESALPEDVQTNTDNPLAPLPPGLFTNVPLEVKDSTAEEEIQINNRTFIPRYVLEQRRIKAAKDASKKESRMAAQKAPVAAPVAAGFNTQIQNSLELPAAAPVTSNAAIVDNSNGFSFDPQGIMDIRKAFMIIGANTKTAIMLSPSVTGVVSRKAEAKNEAEFLEQVLDGTEYFVKFSDKIAYIGNRTDIERLREDFGTMSTREFALKESNPQILPWLVSPQLTSAGKIVSSKSEKGVSTITVSDYIASLYEIERLLQSYRELNETLQVYAASLEYLPQDGQPFDWAKVTDGGNLKYSPINGISSNRAIVFTDDAPKFLAHLGTLKNLVPIAMASQPLSSESAAAAQLSIKTTEVKDFPAQWDKLPQQLGFNASAENERVKLALAIPGSDPDKPEGLTFTISPNEMLVMLVPITVSPLQPEKALGFIPKVWEKKPAPIQKYVLTVFAVEQGAASLPHTALNPAGKKFWAEFYVNAALGEGVSEEQKAFYEKFSTQLAAAAQAQMNIQRSGTKSEAALPAALPDTHASDVPAPAVSISSPSSFNAPWELKKNAPAAAPVQSAPVQSAPVAAPVQTVATPAAPAVELQSKALPEAAPEKKDYDDMPPVITDVEIPNIDMAAERAKARQAEEQSDIKAQKQQSPQNRRRLWRQ